MGDLANLLGLGKGKNPMEMGPGMSTPPIVSPTGGAMPSGPVADVEEAVSVVGDGWKPRKPTLLGALADGYLMSQGMKPAFSINREQRNVQEALEGYQGDPERAINRLMRIRGQQGTALDLLDKYKDNQRADMQAQMLAEVRKERFYNVLRGMLGATNEDNYAEMLPKLRAYQEAKGLDDFDLPDEWNPDTIGALRGGGMTVDQQYDNERDMEKFQQRESRMSSQFSTSQANQNSRFYHGQDRQDARSRMAEAGRQARWEKGQANIDRRQSMTKEEKAALGKMNEGQVIWDNGSPNNSKRAIKRVNGRLIYFEKVGKDRWKKVGNPFGGK